MTNAVHIDGAMGEGGGQVLRTAISLSAITGKPLRIDNIRANRSKSGLLRQHLTALRAAAEICEAKVDGAVLRSTSISFRPGRIQAGAYQFSVGSAGSACLVAQTVLPILLHAEGKSHVEFSGGTHNQSAPTFRFFAHSFLPALREMGADVSGVLHHYGFYPAGGGHFTLDIAGPPNWRPLSRIESGALRSIKVRALLSKLTCHVAERELSAFRELAKVDQALLDLAPESIKSPGPGNVLEVLIEREHTSVISSFGARGRAAEEVGAEAAHETNRLLDANVPVCEHLADQLLLPMALGAGGAFRTLPLSLHTKTNIEVLKLFLASAVHVENQVDGSAVIRVSEMER